MKKYSIVAILLGVFLSVSGASALVSDEIEGGVDAVDCAVITSALRLGSRDKNTNGDVTTLQSYLMQANYLDSDPTGYFGRATLKAVQEFQKANGIVPQGNVGLYTRAKIKELSCTVAVKPISIVRPVIKPTFTYSVMDYNPLKAQFLIGGREQTCTSGKYEIEYGDGEREVASINYKLSLSEPFTKTTPLTADGPTVPPCGGYFSFHTYKQAGTYTVKLFENSSAGFVCNATMGAVCSAPLTKLTQVGELKVTVSTVIPTIKITSATIQETASTQINLELLGSGFTKAATMYLNNCESGSTASFASNSDTQTGTAYEKSYFLECAPSGSYANVYVKDINGVSSNVVKVYVPTFKKIPISSMPTVEVIGAPKLTLQYDSTGKESTLVGMATVKITAGTSGISYYLINGVPNIAKIFDAKGSSVSLKYMDYTSSSMRTNEFITLPAGQSKTYTIGMTASPRQLFAGKYNIGFSDLYDPNEILVPVSSFKGSLTSNTVIIIGETSPYITENVACDATPNVNCTIRGVRFDLTSNVVTLNGVSKTLPSYEGTDINFQASDFGITQTGYYTVQVTTKNGASNGSTVHVSTAPTTVSFDEPKIEFVSAPSLSMQYSSLQKELMIVANGNESMLVGTAKVRIYTGNSPITLHQTSIPYLVQFNNALGAISVNEMTYSAVNSVTGNIVDGGTTIPANTSATFAITNKARASQLFAGVYTLKPGVFNYIDSNNGANKIVSTASFTGVTSSNSVKVIGETSPYITSVSVSPDALTSMGYVITGVRFSPTSNSVTINGVTKVYPSATTYTNSNTAMLNTLIRINLSDFGITQTGDYIVQVATNNGASNRVGVRVNTVSVENPIVIKKCSAIGTRSEGWYDSVTGRLIEYAKCSGDPLPPTPINPPVVSFGDEDTLAPFRKALATVSGTIVKQGELAMRTLSGATTASASGECVDITRNLHRGFETSSVSKLQNFLIEKGFLSEKASGFFGDLTIDAVKAYQRSIGLPETGMVYDLTRQAIKLETCVEYSGI